MAGLTKQHHSLNNIIQQGNLIVFDSDHSCHAVDSNGKTIPGSASNYYMDGDRVVMTGQG